MTASIELINAARAAISYLDNECRRAPAGNRFAKRQADQLRDALAAFEGDDGGTDWRSHCLRLVNAFDMHDAQLDGFLLVTDTDIEERRAAVMVYNETIEARRALGHDANPLPMPEEIDAA